jgi:hypothetical protein
MTIRDSGWKPKGAMRSYGGFEVWDYDHGPHEVNSGEKDPEWFDEELREAAEDADEKADDGRTE